MQSCAPDCIIISVCYIKMILMLDINLNQVIQEVQSQKVFARLTQKHLMNLCLVLSILALFFPIILYLFFSIAFNTHIYYIMPLSFKKMKVFLDSHSPFQPDSCLLLCCIWGNNNKSPNLFFCFLITCSLLNSSINIMSTCIFCCKCHCYKCV